jgi:LDH2 family malate/lactate/ureidoglycolate dehydrogenase
VLLGGTPWPIGGHKGAGLAVLVEVLTGVLSGGAFLGGIVPPEHRSDPDAGESQCCIAIHVGHFMPLADFHARIRRFATDLKRRPRARRGAKILLPGERSARSLVAARERGVSVAPEVRAELLRWAGELGVPAPF